MSDVSGQWPSLDGSTEDGRVRMLSDADWKVYVEQRLNNQDIILRDIRTLLVAGKWGLAIIRWIVVTGGAAVATWAAWKGLGK